MKRDCTSCRRTFTPADLAREESKCMEAERKAAGLEGIRFLYFRCPDCGTNDIFVDILPLEGESPADFTARRDEMEAVVRGLPHGRAEAVVVPVGSP